MKSRSFPLFSVIFCSFIYISTKQVHCDELPGWDEPSNKSTFYTAAVLEYASPTNSTEPETIVAMNLIEYIKWIEKAAEQGVDILVFPEATLNYHGESSAKICINLYTLNAKSLSGITSREDLSRVAVDLQSLDIPDVSQCDYSFYDDVSKLFISFLWHLFLN